MSMNKLPTSTAFIVVTERRKLQRIAIPSSAWVWATAALTVAHCTVLAYLIW